MPAGGQGMLDMCLDLVTLKGESLLSTLNNLESWSIFAREKKASGQDSRAVQVAVCDLTYVGLMSKRSPLSLWEVSALGFGSGSSSKASR